MRFTDILKVFKRKFSVFFCYHPSDIENPKLDEMFRFLKLQTNIKLYSYENYGQGLKDFNDEYRKWAENVIDKVDLVIFYSSDEFLKNKICYKLLLRACKEKFFFEKPEKSRYVVMSDRGIGDTMSHITESTMSIPMEWQEFYSKAIISTLYYDQRIKDTSQIYGIMKDEGIERLRRNLIIGSIIAGVILTLAIIILIIILCNK